MSTAVVRPHIRVVIGGGAQDISEYVISAVKASWGIHGNDPKDRVADPGEMTFSIDNRPEASPPALALGQAVTLSLESDVILRTRTIWRGTIESLRPTPGVRDPKMAVRCVDWMEEASRARLQGLAVMTETQADEVFDALVAAVPNPPIASASSPGSDIYPYALDNVQDEGGSIIGEFQKLAMSEFGLVYVRAGTLVFESRKVRGAGAGSVLFALDEDVITGLSPSNERDNVINRVQVSAHPRRVDASATTVLGTVGSAQRIERNTSITFTVPYRDPNQTDSRVGGVDMVAPVATTDYQFNAAEDGSGVDLTSQLTVVATFGGNSADVTVTNDGPADGYLEAGFQIRGRGIYDFRPVLADLSDATSMATYGQNAYSVDMPYQSSPVVAQDLAQFILLLHKDAALRADSVTFWGNWSDEVLVQMLERNISDRVQITAPSVGLDQVSHINGVTLDISLAGAVRCTWDLAPADTSEFWLLEVAGRTELDETTILGYGIFAPSWILGTDQLGVASYLN